MGVLGAGGQDSALSNPASHPASRPQGQRRPQASATPPARCCRVASRRSGCGHCTAVAVSVCPPPRRWRGHGWHCSLSPYLPGPRQPRAQNSSAASQSAWSDSPAPPRPRYRRGGWGAWPESPPLGGRPLPGWGDVGDRRSPSRVQAALRTRVRKGPPACPGCPSPSGRVASFPGLAPGFSGSRPGAFVIAGWLVKVGSSR